MSRMILVVAGLLLAGCGGDASPDEQTAATDTSIVTTLPPATAPTTTASAECVSDAPTLVAALSSIVTGADLLRQEATKGEEGAEGSAFTRVADRLTEEADRLDDLVFDGSTEGVQDAASQLSSAARGLSAMANSLGGALEAEGDDLDRSAAWLTALMDYTEFLESEMTEETLGALGLAVSTALENCPEALDALNGP